MDAVTADAIGDKAEALKFFSAVALFRDVPESELAHILPMAHPAFRQGRHHSA